MSKRNKNKRGRNKSTKGRARRTRVTEAATASAAEAAQTAEAKPAKKARTKKPAAEPKPKRVSAIDAAAQVLAETGKPMRAKELIEAMAARGLWTSPNGKTPEATLYAANHFSNFIRNTQHLADFVC